MIWTGIGVRLVLAFGVLALSTILVAGVSFSTFTETRNRLNEIYQGDMVALKAAARLNDTGRIIIATSAILISAESNLERNNAMGKINTSIDTMKQIMVKFPEYNHYFLELITQISNSLSLLYANEVKSQALANEFRDLLDGLFPLLIETDKQLANLPSETKKIIDYNYLRTLLYYQSGLAEKLYNDSSYNELDITILRLEELGNNWWMFWQQGQLSNRYVDLHQQLSLIIKLTSRKGRLFELKNQLLDLSYQEKYLLENSRSHLHQLAVQIESYASRVNQDIDASISDTEKELVNNNTLSLLIAFLSLFTAALLSWFYVKKNILQRVRDLQLSMRSISSGNLNTSISIKGRDEITEMAKDVDFFQQTAVTVERTNQQLIATQNELIQAGKLAALGELSVGITHEISQPLTAINSHLRSASIWIQKENMDKAQTNLDKIGKLVDKTAIIIKHLKAFSRKSDGKLEPVDIDSVILEALALLETRIEMSDVVIEYTGRCHQFVLANAIRLEQVIVNVLSNALDAVEGQEEPDITILVESDTEHLYILVKDNGKGIISEALPYIFDPFYTQKTVGKGLGLGLSIAFNIMKDFDGSLSARSKPNQWTIFTIGLKKLKGISSE